MLVFHLCALLSKWAWGNASHCIIELLEASSLRFNGRRLHCPWYSSDNGKYFARIQFTSKKVTATTRSFFISTLPRWNRRVYVTATWLVNNTESGSSSANWTITTREWPSRILVAGPLRISTSGRCLHLTNCIDYRRPIKKIPQGDSLKPSFNITEKSNHWKLMCEVKRAQPFNIHVRRENADQQTEMYSGKRSIWTIYKLLEPRKIMPS